MNLGAFLGLSGRLPPEPRISQYGEDERAILSAAAFSPLRDGLNEIIEDLKPPGAVDAHILQELREDYPALLSLPDSDLAMLLEIRKKRYQLCEKHDVPVSERSDIPVFAEATPRGRSYQRRIEGKVREWISSEAPAEIHEACVQEIVLLKRMLLIDRLGGGFVYANSAGVLQEYLQYTRRDLASPGMLGYNDLLGIDLTQTVLERIREQEEVSIMDAGGGQARAFGALVENLDRLLGEHRIEEDETGSKILVYPGGKLLYLACINRKEYNVPGFVQQIVADICRLKGSGFDEIWDVQGPVEYESMKRELIEQRYYEFLKKEGEEGCRAGVMRFTAGGFRFMDKDGSELDQPETWNALGIPGIESKKTIGPVVYITRREEALHLPLSLSGVAPEADNGDSAWSGRVSTYYQIRQGDSQD